MKTSSASNERSPSGGRGVAVAGGTIVAVAEGTAVTVAVGGKAVVVEVALAATTLVAGDVASPTAMPGTRSQAAIKPDKISIVNPNNQRRIYPDTPSSGKKTL